MEDNRMAGLHSGTTLSTTFLSAPHSSAVEEDGWQQTRWFAYRVVPLCPFAPLQLQLQLSQEAQELASAQMMVTTWLANNRNRYPSSLRQDSIGLFYNASRASPVPFSASRPGCDSIFFTHFRHYQYPSWLSLTNISFCFDLWRFFIRPESDHWLPLSLTDWLTDWP